MGWLFSTQLKTKKELMIDCAKLTQKAIDDGWELLHAKLCQGGFALAYKNMNTGEMSISYHLAKYSRSDGWGEKEVDPFIAWEVLPQKTVSDYMKKYGDKTFHDGETYCQCYERIKKEVERKKQRMKTELIRGKWYCINKFGYSSMPLGVGRLDGTRGRSLIFGGYRIVGLKKTDIVAGEFDTKTEAELWIVQNKLANLPGSYAFDEAEQYISKNIELAKASIKISTYPEYVEKQKKTLTHYSSLLAIMQQVVA